MRKIWVVVLAAACAVVLFGRGPGSDRPAAPPGVWTPIGPFGGNIVGLAQNPKSPSELYAASESWPGQVWRSTNGGESWVRQSAVTDRPRDLVADPRTPGTLYFLGYNSLRISKDKGKTFDFRRLPAGFSGYNGRIAVHPTNPRIIIISGSYCYDDKTYKDVPAVAKTTNGGATWTIAQLTRGSDYGNGYDIAVAKANPSYVYVCGYDNTNGVTVPRVFVSKNGGASWTNVASGAAFPGDNNHCTALWVDPRDPKKVWVAHTEGIARSANAGRTWKLQQTPRIAWVTAVSGDATNPKVLHAGGQLNGVRGSLKSTDGGVTWSLSSKGVFGDCRRLLAAGAKIFWAGNVGVFQSKDGGASWAAACKGIRGAKIDIFAVAPSSPNVILAGIPYYALLKTANGGALWTACGSFYGDAYVGSLAVHPTKPSTIYVKPYG